MDCLDFTSLDGNKSIRLIFSLKSSYIDISYGYSKGTQSHYRKTTFNNEQIVILYDVCNLLIRSIGNNKNRIYKHLKRQSFVYNDFRAPEIKNGHYHHKGNNIFILEIDYDLEELYITHGFNSGKKYTAMSTISLEDVIKLSDLCKKAITNSVSDNDI